MAPLVGQRIQDLVSSLDPSYTIDSQAQEQLLQLTDDFLDKVCKQSLRLATHRGSTVMEVQDVQLVLAKQWGIVIPGLGPPILNKSRATPIPSSTTHSGTSSKQSSGTKRKSSSSHKSTSASTSTGATQHQSQPNKNSKQNESNQVTA
jgi:transcription initiation factor TFIID subunit 12